MFNNNYMYWAEKYQKSTPKTGSIVLYRSSTVEIMIDKFPNFSPYIFFEQSRIRLHTTNLYHQKYFHRQKVKKYPG